MAQSATNVHVGPARIWTGVTAPATGTPPTLLSHTDGVPGTGTEVGHTTSDVTFTYQLKKNELKSDQHYGPVDVYPTEEMVKIEFTAMERTYTMLKLAFDNIGNVDDGSKTLFYAGAVGSAGGILSPSTSCVVFTSRIRTAPTKFEVGVIYKAYSVEGIQLTYSRTKESTFKVTMIGLSDTSRNVGDTMFQWFREK